MVGTHGAWPVMGPRTWSRSSARSPWTRNRNEIPAVQDLLKAFADLAGTLITIDAIHTQSETALVIPGRRADYLITVKGNMPTLSGS